MAEAPSDCGKKPKKVSSRAQSRRNTESGVFYELAQLLPLSRENTMKQDKLSILRLTLAYLKFRKLIENEDSDNETEDAFARASRSLKKIPLHYDITAELDDDQEPVAIFDNDGNLAAGALSRRRPSQDEIKVPEEILSQLEQDFLSRESQGSNADDDPESRRARLQRYKEGLERGMQEFLYQNVSDNEEGCSARSGSDDEVSNPLLSANRKGKEDSTSKLVDQQSETHQSCSSLAVRKSTTVSVPGESAMMLEAAPGFFMTIDRDMKILYVSENTSQFLGYYQSYFIGQDVRDFVYDKDLDELLGQMDESKLSEERGTEIKPPQARRTFYVAMSFCFQKPGSRTKECGYALYQWNARLLLTKKKSTGTVHIKGLLAMCRPVHTDSFVLLESRANYIFVRYDLALKIVYCDPKMEELTGYQPKDLIGMSGYTFKHPCDAMMCGYNHRKLLAEGKGDSGYYRVISRSGAWMWVYSQLFMTYDRTGKPTFVTTKTYIVSPEEAERVLSREKRDYDRMRGLGFGMDFAEFCPKQRSLASISAEKELRSIKMITSRESIDSQDKDDEISGSTGQPDWLTRDIYIETVRSWPSFADTTSSKSVKSAQRRASSGTIGSPGSDQSSYSSDLKSLASSATTSKGGPCKSSKKSRQHKRPKLSSSCDETDDEPMSVDLWELSDNAPGLKIQPNCPQRRSFDESISSSYTDITPNSSESCRSSSPQSMDHGSSTTAVQPDKISYDDSLTSSEILSFYLSTNSNPVDPLSLERFLTDSSMADLGQSQDHLGQRPPSGSSQGVCTDNRAKQVADDPQSSFCSMTVTDQSARMPCHSNVNCSNISPHQVVPSTKMEVDDNDMLKSTGPIGDLLDFSLNTLPCTDVLLSQQSGDVMFSSTAFVRLRTPTPTRQRQIFQLKQSSVSDASVTQCTRASDFMGIDNNLQRCSNKSNPANITQPPCASNFRSAHSTTKVSCPNLQSQQKTQYPHDFKNMNCSQTPCTTSAGTSTNLATRNTGCSTSDNCFNKLAHQSSPTASEDPCSSASDCVDCQLRHQRKCMARQRPGKQLRPGLNHLSCPQLMSPSCHPPQSGGPSLSRGLCPSNRADIPGKLSGLVCQQPSSSNPQLKLPEDLVDLELDSEIMNDLTGQNWIKYL